MRFVLLFVFCFSLAYSAPAMPFLRTFTQSDGTTFKARAKGDEYLHYIKTKEGDILLYNPKTKNYDYAIIKGSRLAPSGIPYKKQSTRNAVTRIHATTITKKDLHRLRIQAIKRFQAASK